MIILSLISLVYLIYPTVSNMLDRKVSDNIINSYKQSLSKDSNINNKELIKIDNYNLNLFSGKLYEGIPKELGLNINDLIGYIEIPCIDIKSPIYLGTNNSVLKKGVGVLEGTSIPVGGINTHSILAAHTGLTNKKLFTDLDKLQNGDIFFIHSFGRDLEYKVEQIKVVNPEDTEDVRIIKNKDYVTLITCYPYGINTQRLLVRGERIYDDNKVEDVSNKSTNMYQNKINLLLIFPILAVLIILIVAFIKSFNERKLR